MKVSKYTKLIKQNNKYFIYNAISNFLCEVDKSLFMILENKQNMHIELNDLEDNDAWSLLLNNKILTENDKDDLLLITAHINQMRRTSEVLNLTLAPTMNCNFNCPYCFETKESGIMSNETIKNIVNLVQNYKNIKHINLTWFGGEPLLAPQVIEKISKEICNSKIYTYSASIITNGYFLTTKNLQMLKESKVDTIQVSMDGIFEDHNKKRFTITDKSTFSKIIANIDDFSRSDYEISLCIRMNIDKDNMSNYSNINNFFHEKYGQDKRISLHPAFIIDTTKNNNENAINDVDVKLDFWKKVASNSNNANFIYPKSQIYECAVRNYNTWSIDAKADVFKCWEIIGNKDYKVGELTNEGIKITNIKLLNRYLYGANHLENPKCKDCFSLPLCGGGCPHKRIENEFNNKDFNICMYGDNLDKYLIERIKMIS